MDVGLYNIVETLLVTGRIISTLVSIFLLYKVRERPLKKSLCKKFQKVEEIRTEKESQIPRKKKTNPEESTKNPKEEIGGKSREFQNILKTQVNFSLFGFKFSYIVKMQNEKS